MNEQQKFDEKQSTPPHDCAEDGHEFRLLGTDGDGAAYFECRWCGKEHEE